VKTIIIAGCSWGAGSWGDNGEIDHSGLAQYLMDIGYNVVNLSQPGLGPFSILQPIDNFLYVNEKFLDIERIFILQSDIARDMKPYDRHTATTTYKLKAMDPTDLDNNIKHTYRDFYSKLNTCAETWQCKISLIGGLTDLVMEFDLEFPHLDFTVPSWIQLIHPEAVPVYIHELENIPEQHKDKEQLLPFLDAVNATFRLFKKSAYFPDNLHPDRYGHKILFDHLQDLGLLRI
jgi:hypothetical protein